MAKPGQPGGNAGQQKPAQNSGGGGVVVSSESCMAETCKQKSSKAGFCVEHFVWFKEGLITRDGRRPSDFDKKFQAFKRRTDKAA